MNAPTLSQQAEACELAAHRTRQGKAALKLRSSEQDELARRLDAAAQTLRELMEEPGKQTQHIPDIARPNKSTAKGS